MGSNSSKSSYEAAVHTQKNDTESSNNADPRSPTPEITRTPLQGKAGSKHHITKNADLRKHFEGGNYEEELIHNNPILSAVIRNHLQSYDPRSPTQEFERTPIIIESKIDKMTDGKKILRLQNVKNCASPCLRNGNDNETYDSCAEAQESPDLMVPKNLCNDFFDITLNDTIKDTDEPLGSSTASNEAIENNISNGLTNTPTQLLETDFSYVDPSLEKLGNGKENMQNVNFHDTGDKMEDIKYFKILNEDPRSPSTGIERTPIVVTKVDDSIEENVEDMSDDTLIKVLQSTNAELRQIITQAQDNPEELLIFEDESTGLNDTPKKSKSSSSGDSRTPLSCMKNKADSGHIQLKSKTISDHMDKKVANRVSHIPRLKSLSKQTRLNPVTSSVSLKSLSKPSVVSGDCENTPPHSHRDKWDKDCSIVL